jgi:hypothetical protein
MNYRAMLWVGAGITALSLFGMIYLHESTLSASAFIIGIIIASIGYAKLPATEKQAINTKQINENIQKFNDVLWGEKRKQKSPQKLCPICGSQMNPDGQLILPIPGTKVYQLYNRFHCPSCSYRFLEK